MAIAGDSVDRELARQPRRWDIRSVRNFMVVFGCVSSVFDFLTFGVLIFVFQAGPDMFRTAWFVESLLTELVIALIMRTNRPFYASRPGRWLLFSTLTVIVFTLALPYLPLSGVFGFVPLPLAVLATLLAITVGYVVLSEAVKRYVYKPFAAPRRGAANGRNGGPGEPFGRAG
jgi:Mg2+-importing ATPase